MKKIIVLSILLVAVIQHGVACDICGCSLGGNYFGILPLYNKNFIGLRWSQAKFHSYMAPTQNMSSQHSNDTYNKMEVWGRFYVAKRVQVFAFIPYVYNDMNGSDQNVSAHGLGDINVMTNFVVVNTSDNKSDFKHMLIGGGGMKLPTGKFSMTDKGKIINRNFQVGTGSLDFNLNVVYTLRYKKTGINVESGYKINTRNRDEYLFGNQYRASAQLFFWHKAGLFSFLPHGGINYEQAARHRNGEIIQVNTGGSAWLGSGGIDVYIGRVTVGVNYQKPISQHYNSDESADITSKARWTSSVTFNF